LHRVTLNWGQININFFRVSIQAWPANPV